MTDRHELLWSLLMRVEQPNYLRAGLLGKIGLNEASSERLRAYVRQCLLEDQQHQRSLMRDLCAELTQEVSLQVLVSKLETLDEATDQWRKTRLAGLSSILDAESIARLERWIEKQRQQGSMQVVRNDYRKFLSQPGAREAVLEQALQMCRTLES